MNVKPSGLQLKIIFCYCSLALQYNFTQNRKESQSKFSSSAGLNSSASLSLFSVFLLTCLYSLDTVKYTGDPVPLQIFGGHYTGKNPIPEFVEDDFTVSLQLIAGEDPIPEYF